MDLFLRMKGLSNVAALHALHTSCEEVFQGLHEQSLAVCYQKCNSLSTLYESIQEYCFQAF